MKIFKTKKNLKKEILSIKNVSFVPTMGGLHEGHKSLIKRAKKFKKKVIVSIFVNYKQFNNKRDFKQYPRNLKKDLSILKHLKVDFVYLPNNRDIYDFQVRNKIFLDKFSKKLCGKKRKGHFKGVLNVINRFLEIIKPKYLFLGIKDFQQLYLINRHIFKSKINTKVVACKTIRENNGVACSTRNDNLTNNQFDVASKVYHYLNKEKKFKPINLKKIKFHLLKIGVDKIDYLELINIQTLKKPRTKNEKFKFFIAYYLKKTRLIDNV